MEAETTITIWHILGVGISLGVPLSGAMFAVFKYSVGRNITAMDKKFEALEAQVDKIGKKVDEINQSYGREGMTRVECRVCRQECADRSAAYQRDILEWLRRSDDKVDKLMMMLANVHNGMGGLNNRSTDKP
jgi:hypothetical protein